MTFWLLLTSLLARPDEVIAPGAAWRFWPGRTEASSPDAAAWRGTGFDDTGWQSGPAPFFFGKPLNGTELREMLGNYSSVYLRHEFTLTDPDTVGELMVRVLADDGFVAFLNGKEIGRHNVPDGELPASALASTALPEPLAQEEIVVAEPWKILKSGKNVLAVHALNSALGSPDFLLSASADVVRDTVAPTVTEQVPPSGSIVDELTQIEVVFSEAVAGVDAGDLLINGVAATSVIAVSPNNFQFTFAQPAPGPVEFAWSSGHGITDIVGRSHPFIAANWSVVLNPAAAQTNLMITEFMADNDKTLYDDDCDRPDWIEIFNSGPADINLSGWSLTDDPSNPGKWTFPNYTLLGGNYLVVFASSKNKLTVPTAFAAACKARTNRALAFHTNFKLSASGGYLALTAPDRTIISEIKDYPAQTRDVSYGRVPGTEQLGFFAQPTPNAPNTISGAGFTPEVEFSRATGPVEQSFELTLRSADTNAIIHFTTDGTFPGAGSPIYTQPLTITNIVQVRARAFAPGLLPSAPRSETFLMITNSPANSGTLTSSLPIIVITTLKSASPTATRNTTVHMSFFEPVHGLTTLKSRPTLVTRGGIKIRGSSTEGEPQSNFAVDVWDEFDQDHDVKPFGMPADSEWVLFAPNEFDAGLIHNPFTMELSRQMGFYGPRTRFVEVYLNKGGVLASNQWQGLYVWMEKPGLSKGRVDAPKAQPEDVAEPEVTGSYLFKTDRLDGAGGDTGFSAGGTINAYVEPKEREMKSAQRAPQVAYLKKYFSDVDKAISPSNPKRRDPVEGYKAYINVTNWVDYHILEMLSGQVDAIRLSSYWYKRRNGKIEYGPRWDYDRAWESKGDGRDDSPRVWDTGGGLWGPPNWWRNLFLDVDAWQVYIDRFEGFRQGPLSLANMYAVIDRMTNEVRFTQPREAKKWANTVPRASYPNEIRIMKNWISNRVVWLDNQMAQPPLLSSQGGTVPTGYRVEIIAPTNISSPTNVTIFYTLDGSDPRASTGTAAITSFKYEGPITIVGNSRVVARLRDQGRFQRSGPPSSTPWSAAVAATFIVTPPPLILTEIMFHPQVPAGSSESAGDFEFLELKNISNHDLDLTGYHFTDGIEFNFTTNNTVRTLAPGARILLVRNQTAFLRRYPGVANIAGEFAGALADEGEHIALAGPVEEPIFDISYGDKWQPLADGYGFSLVLRDENIPPSELGNPASWRLSAALGGSPGGVDPAPPARVVISEVQPRSLTSASGQIELENLENAAVDISGWWLSDDFANPRKVRLSANTRVTAGGFLVLPESVVNLPNGQGFALDSVKGSIWLFSADADGNLTGWSHGFEFGASEPGQSFGRSIDSYGNEEFPLQKIATLGTANSGPQESVVVISEIMYHPPDLPYWSNTDDEYVEIENRSGAQVPLYDSTHPTNAWRLRGGIDFDFPANINLTAGGRLLIVGFDPVAEPLRLGSLRRRAGWPSNTPVFGPWRGGLANEGDTIRLERPTAPTTKGTNEIIPYIIVDQASYDSKEPWPVEADGSGAALVRRKSAGYGDDPQNWIAAARLAAGLDSDDDGLPDEWEAAFQLNPASGVGNDGADGDPDGDGFSNWLEFLNGTDPRDAASRFSVGVNLNGGQMDLFVAAPAGQRFRVESSPTLTPAVWTSLGDITVESTGVTLLNSIPVQAGAGYFRVAIP